MSMPAIPIRRIGRQDNLFLGGDRELVMFSGLLAGLLVFAAMDWRAAPLGIALWIFALFALRLMAKSDPMMRPVYLRSLKYQDYYPPRSTHARVTTPQQTRRYG